MTGRAIALQVVIMAMTTATTRRGDEVRATLTTTKAKDNATDVVLLTQSSMVPRAEVAGPGA